VEIHGQLTEVQEERALLRNHMWVWCDVSENSRADVDDNKRPSSRSITYENIWRVYILIRQVYEYTISKAQLINILFRTFIT
jgi:hypothetical protein